MKKFKLAALCALLLLAAGCQNDPMEGPEPRSPRSTLTRSIPIPPSLQSLCPKIFSPDMPDPSYTRLINHLAYMMDYYPVFGVIIGYMANTGYHLSFALDSDLSDLAQYDPLHDKITFRDEHIMMNVSILMQEIFHAVQHLLIRGTAWNMSAKNREFEVRVVIDCIMYMYNGIEPILRAPGSHSFGFRYGNYVEYIKFLSAHGWDMAPFNLFARDWNDEPAYIDERFDPDFFPSLLELFLCSF